MTVAIVNAETSTSVRIDEADLQIQSYRGSGPGGQHRNKSDTAVRILHVPSQIIVRAERERSWWQNKQQALEELRRRLEASERASAAAKANEARVDQIGQGLREQHDWTWCGWRNQVTDHTTNKKVSMDRALKGNFGPLLK